MAGLGWANAYGAAGASAALGEIMKQRELDKYHAEQLQQQQFNNNLATRGAARADQALKQSGDEHQLNLLNHQTAEKDRVAKEAAAATDKQFTEATTQMNTVPGDTPYGMDSPQLKGMLQFYPSLMKHVDATPGTGDAATPFLQVPSGDKTSDPVVAGQLRATTSPAQPEHYMKLESQAEKVARQTNERGVTSEADRVTNNDTMNGIKRDVADNNANNQRDMVDVRNRLADIAAARPAPGAGAAEGRAETAFNRSYDRHSKGLDDIKKPLASKAADAATLTDLLNARDASSDSLVAPKMLTLIAGGQGSGVRITNAELDRVMGGRSFVEAARGQMLHWTTGTQFDDATRARMTALIKLYAEKIHAKLGLIDKGGMDLIDAGSLDEHRRIFHGVSTGLEALDAPDQAPAATTTDGGALPPGVTVRKH